MMADIFLSHGFFLEEDEKEKLIMKPYPPLGILYLSAYLKNKGIAAEIFDTTFGTKEECASWLQASPKNVIGLYATHMTRENVVWMIGKAKGLGWTTVLGGPDSVNYPEQYIKHGADVIVRGEGETTLLELLPALDKSGKHRLHGIEGVIFRDERGKIVRNPMRKHIDINTIPWPDHEAIDIHKYLHAWSERHGFTSLNLITARGCPYRCRWCSHSVFGNTHRKRDFRDCADEVGHLKEMYNPNQLWYADDVFTIDHKWLFNFSAELKRRNLKIPFETISRADRLMSDDILRTLAEMSCTQLWIGAESGSDRILKAMNRDVTAEQILWVTRRARQHGIKTGLFLMWGYEGETVEDIEETIEHVKRTQPDMFMTTVVYPIKNTPYFKDIEEKIIPPESWAQSTEKDYKVSGRHSREYYRCADKWLQAEVEASRLEQTDPEKAAQKKAESVKTRDRLFSLYEDREA